MSLPDLAMTKAEKKALKKERQRFESVKNAHISLKKKLLSLLIFIGIVGVIGFAIFNSYIPLPEAEKQKPVDRALATDWVAGNLNAPVVLVEYSDFQCPACQVYAPIIEELKKTYPDRLAIVYRHFPLKTIHLQATLAAEAAEAAGKQGKFWDMYTLLFANQADWAEKPKAKAIFITYAESLNLDIAQFKKDLGSKEIKALVEADYRSGIMERLNQTPTFFLNGERLQNPQGIEAFKNLIDPLFPATPSAETML